MGVGNKGVEDFNRNYLVLASGPFVASLYSYVLILVSVALRLRGLLR